MNPVTNFSMLTWISHFRPKEQFLKTDNKFLSRFVVLPNTACQLGYCDLYAMPQNNCVGYFHSVLGFKKMTFHLKSQISIGVKFLKLQFKLSFLTLPGVTLWDTKIWVPKGAKLGQASATLFVCSNVSFIN